MRFKLIIALVADEYTEKVIEAARGAGATGATVIKSARGEGLKPVKTFLGLTLEGQVDVILYIVEQHLSRKILERIAEEGRFGDKPGSGVVFQVPVEDAVGLGSQLDTIKQEIEGQL